METQWTVPLKVECVLKYMKHVFPTQNEYLEIDGGSNVHESHEVDKAHP